MKADTVIIGGGLAALTAGIRLLKEGQNVIIVSSGQSALHFSSGSLSLMNNFNGEEVENPFDKIPQLSVHHPYKKCGDIEKLKFLLKEGIEILREGGVRLKGDFTKNHYRLTPFGVFVPAWFTIDDHFTIESEQDLSGKKICIVGIDGFLDFYPTFLEAGLTKHGALCEISSVNIEEFSRLRNNPTEMRAPNIARLIDDSAIERYAQAINSKILDGDLILIPSVIGLNDFDTFTHLRDLVKLPVFTISTIPVAVTGIRMKIQLQNYFTSLGGWYLLGDTVTDGKIWDDRLLSVNTSNLGSTEIKADNFILATGGLFSRGLQSTNTSFYEPIFGLDVIASSNRSEWYDTNFYHSQPFMTYGVETDECFRCKLKGRTLQNLYGAGGVIGGNFDPLKDGVGAGVTISTAMYVANRIIN